MGHISNKIVLKRSTAVILMSISITPFFYAQTESSLQQSAPVIQVSDTLAQPRSGAQKIIQPNSGQSNSKYKKDKKPGQVGKNKNTLSRKLGRSLKAMRAAVWGKHGWSAHYLRRVIALTCAAVGVNIARDVCAWHVAEASIHSDGRPYNAEDKKRQEEAAREINKQREKRLAEVDSLLHERGRRLGEREEERQQAQMALEIALSSLDRAQNDQDEKIEDEAIKTVNSDVRLQFLKMIIDNDLEGAVKLIEDPFLRERYGQEAFERHQFVNNTYVHEIRKVLEERVRLRSLKAQVSIEPVLAMTLQEAIADIKDLEFLIPKHLVDATVSSADHFISITEISDLLRIMIKLEEPGGDLEMTKSLLIIRSFYGNIQDDILEQIIQQDRADLLDLVWIYISFANESDIASYVLAHNIGMVKEFVSRRRSLGGPIFLAEAIKRGSLREMEAVIQHIDVSHLSLVSIVDPIFVNNDLSAFAILIRKIKGSEEGINAIAAHGNTFLDLFIWSGLRDPAMLQLLINEGARASTDEVDLDGRFGRYSHEQNLYVVKRLIFERRAIGIEDVEALRLATNYQLYNEARDIIFDGLGHIPEQLEEKFRNKHLEKGYRDLTITALQMHYTLIIRPKMLPAEIEYRNAVQTLLSCYTPMPTVTGVLVEEYLLPKESEEVKLTRKRQKEADNVV